MRRLSYLLGVVMLQSAVAVQAATTDDMLMYSDRFNNGWGDSWSWMPRYATNNPVHAGSNSMACVPSGTWQAWWLKSGTTIDTRIYTNVSFWLNGGTTGGQNILISGELDGSIQPGVWVTAPTNSWKQIIVSLAALGITNKTNLTGFQIGNGTSTQRYYIDDLRLVAAPVPAVVHVSVLATQTVRKVDGKVFGINQVAWDPNVNTPATAAILNDIGSTCMRWPGGSWADGYHWANEAWNEGSSGPRYWGSFSSDFIALATNTHSDAFAIVNYGTGTPEEAAYGVSMFNITNHCNFKYWEVGNEIGGSWEWDWRCPGLRTNDILNLPSLASKLETPTNNISTYLRSQLSSSTLSNLDDYISNPSAYDSALRWALVNDLNNLMYNSSQSIYKTDPNRFTGVTFRSLTWTNLSLPVPPIGQDLPNRMTIEDAYPELAKLTPAVNWAGNWPNVYLPHDPWTYAMRFRDYYMQMKAIDPTIKVGALADIYEDGTINYTNHPVVNPRTGVTHNGWTPVMLTYLRNTNCIPDFLIVHDYGPTAGDTQDLLYPGVLASRAATLRQMVTDYLGAAGTNVTLEITEYGMGGDKQSCSLPGGLFYADSIGQTLQTEFNSRMWWDMRNGVNSLGDSDPEIYGWRKDGSGNYISDAGIVYGQGGVGSAYPTYYCAKLMPHFAADGDTVVSATSDYPLLAAYSVKRTNGALTLLVINKSSSSSLTAAINLTGYLPVTNATVYSYGIPQDEAARLGVGSPDITQTYINGVQSNFSFTFAPFSATVMVLGPANQPPFTPANVAATASNAAVVLTWAPATGADSYIIRRSTTSGGSYLTIASGVTATSYLDTGLINGTTYYYVVAATNAYGDSSNSVEVSAIPGSKLAGTIIGSSGSWSNLGNTVTNAFDGNTNTFYDAANASGDWAGLNLGTPKRITQIRYCPRNGFASRMVGGVFQGASNKNFTDAVTLFTISSAPPDGAYTSQSISTTNAYLCVRYLGPTGAWCNVAEVEFYGYAPLSAYTQWQFQYFGCTNCPQADPNADPLGKGMSNTNQFLAGLDPTNSASAFRILSITPTGSDIVVTWQSAAGKTNYLQAGALTNYADVTGPIVITSSPTNATDFGGATNASPRFYRIRLWP